MISLGKEIAVELEHSAEKGFDILKVARVAFKIYQERGLELSADMDRALLILVTMEEGPEFELTEAEFNSLIAEIRKM